ncbi:hypothetical protein BDY21DRAFT_358375 [Lineolata rhizophorae]|uniref:Uncharacterized protein n=1 Tax=Lineolata rhizophorae TaxID=578093 RepID=A0A6A6NLY6_9PEZI|nr:hypothetical protein BDY21DRAFT_358375 [Lineolata rhizophorae]
MSDHVVSTGRGGQGNIGHDPHTYVDAGIVREGTPVGEHSAGRGGAGNIGTSPRQGPVAKEHDVVPEMSMRPEQENYHTGRGGGGNVHKEKYGGHTHGPEHENLIDKAKHLIGLDKKKEGETEESK